MQPRILQMVSQLLCKYTTPNMGSTLKTLSTLKFIKWKAFSQCHLHVNGAREEKSNFLNKKRKMADRSIAVHFSGR